MDHENLLITIQKTECGYRVRCEDLYDDGLCPDEVIGEVSRLLFGLNPRYLANVETQAARKAKWQSLTE